MGSVSPLMPRRKKGLTDLQRVIDVIERRCDGKREFIAQRFADLGDLVCQFIEQAVEATLTGGPQPPVPEGLAECLSDVAPVFAEAGVHLPEDPREAAKYILLMFSPAAGKKRRPWR